MGCIRICRIRANIPKRFISNDVVSSTVRQDGYHRYPVMRAIDTQSIREIIGRIINVKDNKLRPIDCRPQ